MPFCPKCGKEVPKKAIYCPSCGSQVRRGVDEDWKAGTGLDLLLRDATVQMSWARRLIAYLIDSFIVSVAVFVVGMILTIPLIIGSIFRGSWLTWRSAFGLPVSIGIVQIFYFTIAEGGYGASIGKQVMGLEVTDVEGNTVGFSRALIRNVSKVFWALLLLDVFIGLFSLADPRQKYTDQIAGTRVVDRRTRYFNREAAPPTPRKKVAARPSRERGDPLGLVNAGVILITIASAFLLYPGILSEFIKWVEGWSVGGPTMVPNSLLDPVIWFFSVLGGWSLVMALIRLISGINRRSSISDAYGGVFMLSVAFFVREYSHGLMTLTVLLPVLVIALGAFVLLSSATSYMLYERL